MRAALAAASSLAPCVCLRPFLLADCKARSSGVSCFFLGDTVVSRGAWGLPLAEVTVRWPVPSDPKLAFSGSKGQRRKLGIMPTLTSQCEELSLLTRSLKITAMHCTQAVVWNSEDLFPPSERFIFNFNSKDEVKKWHLYSDSEYGGLSSASLEITDSVSGGDTSSTGVFSGNLSLDMSEGSPWRIRRSGFCGMRSKKFDGYIDLDSYDTIAMKLRGDGRTYISTIYTENWVNSPGQEEDNSWQAFVYVPHGSWRILKIPLDSYLPTWKGNVIEANMEMNPSRVVGMSLSLNAEGGVPGAKTGPGDFRLDVDWIKAMRIDVSGPKIPSVFLPVCLPTSFTKENLILYAATLSYGDR
uniref:NADH:ubiquinone oxidoreductase intermediate-associated protein 30 domain-containing protein n=1 Tax=Aegilops tauschii TaxID=37682 RepID=R7WD59_AEGTA